MQDRTAWPSSSTVHAPHCPSPQPYLAPVRSRSSRSTLSRLRSGAAFTGRLAPFTLSSVIRAMHLLSAIREQLAFSHPRQHTDPVLDHRWIGHLPVSSGIWLYFSDLVFPAGGRVEKASAPRDRGLELLHFRSASRSRKKQNAQLTGYSACIRTHVVRIGPVRLHPFGMRFDAPPGKSHQQRFGHSELL